MYVLKGHFVHLHVELLRNSFEKTASAEAGEFEQQINANAHLSQNNCVGKDFYCPSGTEITRTNLRNQINCCQLFLKGFVAEGGAEVSIKASRPHPSRSIVISDGHQEATKAEKVKSELVSFEF